jgi:hypothetical protein
MANTCLVLNSANREYETEKGVFNLSDERSYIHTNTDCRQVTFMLSPSEWVGFTIFTGHEGP